MKTFQFCRAASRWLAFASAALLPFAVTPAAAQAPAKQPFKLAINWFPTGDHAAYFVAQEKGYFEKAGLDVQIENSKGSGDSLAKADTGVVLEGIARGAKVKIIGMIFDETPQNIFSRADLPLRTPKDLVGKSIGAPPGDSQRMAWPAFARQNGIDPNSVTWVNVEPTAKVPAVAAKRVDGVADLLTGQYNYDQAIGADKVVQMPWAKFGFNMYSMAFIASEETLAKKPEQVRAFLKAAYTGWRDVMADREPSLAIYKKRAPEIDLPFIRSNQAIGIDLMRTTRYAQNGIGWIEEKKMCDSEIANKYMGLPKQVDCKTVFTNQYLTKVALPLPVKN